MKLTTINYYLSKIGILLVVVRDEKEFTEIFFETKKSYNKRIIGKDENSNHS